MVKVQEVTVGAAIFNEKGELLFVKRSLEDDLYPGFWELPGGTTDFGEKPEAALTREIKEECGLDIKVIKPLTTATYFVKKENIQKQCVEIIFLCEFTNNSQTVKLSFEHSEFIFRDPKNLREIKLSDYMAEIVRNVQKAL